MSQGFDRWETDGVWWEPEPWFLDGVPWIEERIFPREWRIRAATALQRVYTAAACRRIQQDESLKSMGPAIVLFLPNQLPGLIMPFLELGLDLADADDWSDRQLFERLLDRDEFRGRRRPHRPIPR